jgi:hypothetical protein
MRPGWELLLGQKEDQRQSSKTMTSISAAGNAHHRYNNYCDFELDYRKADRQRDLWQ